MPIEMKFGTPTYEPMNSHPTGLHGKVELTNGAEAVDAGKFTISMLAKSEDSSESQAGLSMDVPAQAAGEVSHPEISLQCDPGKWTVSWSLASNDTGETITTDPQTVHIEGPTHHAAQFADSSKLQFNIEVTHVTQEASGLVKVDYHLTNSGTVAILPGFPITLALSSPNGTTAGQEYKIEAGVAKGASEPKYLHVEADKKHEGDTSDLLVIGDMGGLAAKEFRFKVTWKADGTADVAAG
jgi:hypothetical protein